jgi:two-component system, cell cycle sensor histidine kinase and response regulator CckA
MPSQGAMSSSPSLTAELAFRLGIIRSHGGFINVYSEVGKGTSFKVHYPAAPDGAVADETPSDTTVYEGAGELILVADDELAIREIIKLTLENHNYRVITSTDGAEAVGTFAQQKDDVKLVIMDMAMPVMDGVAAMRALRTIRSDVPVLAISGRIEYNQSLENSKKSPLQFLAKPFTTEQLLEVLHKMLATSRPKVKSRRR